MQLPNARSAGCEQDWYVQVRKGITFVAGGCLPVLLMILTQLLHHRSSKTMGGERLAGWGNGVSESACESWTELCLLAFQHTMCNSSHVSF